MMYGTRKEVTRLIKRAFGGEEKLALLVWTEQDVMAQAEDMTTQEADAILCEIGNAGLYDHMDGGISSCTVRELLAGLRAGRETVTLNAGARSLRAAALSFPPDRRPFPRGRSARCGEGSQRIITYNTAGEATWHSRTSTPQQKKLKNHQRRKPEGARLKAMPVKRRAWRRCCRRPRW